MSDLAAWYLRIFCAVSLSLLAVTWGGLSWSLLT